MMRLDNRKYCEIAFRPAAAYRVSVTRPIPQFHGFAREQVHSPQQGSLLLENIAQ